jgi:hypothetical protein
MWNKFTGILANATSFLQNGKVPPNTPLQYREDLSKINFFSSKKFFIVFSSILLLMFFYLTSVGILFLTSFFPAITGSYVIIFVESVKIFAIIISVYLGLQASIDFKYQSLSQNTNNNVYSVEQSQEKIIQETTIRYAEKYKNDPSYAPIEWALNQEGGQ